MNPVNTASGLPLWLQQILPQWFADRPAFTEAVYAGSISLFYATAPVFGAIYGVALSEGQADSPGHLLGFIDANWWGLLCGYIFGGGIAGIRAKQAANKAAKGP